MRGKENFLAGPVGAIQTQEVTWDELLDCAASAENEVSQFVRYLWADVPRAHWPSPDYEQERIRECRRRLRMHRVRLREVRPLKRASDEERREFEDLKAELEGILSDEPLGHAEARATVASLERVRKRCQDLARRHGPASDAVP